MAGFQGLRGADNSADELLTGCRFYFSSPSVDRRPILEIAGLSVECPPAGGNQNFGSMQFGQKLRQATPTNQKLVPVVVKCVATNNNQMFEWYTLCNNDSKAQEWANNREEATIWAYDQRGEIKARWEIVNAYPCKYAGPDFKSGDENMANETIELVHEGIRREE